MHALLANAWVPGIAILSAAAMAVGALVLRQRWKLEQRALAHYFDVLARQEGDPSLWPAPLDQLPPLPAASPLRQPAERFLQALQQHVQWLQQQQHLRAAGEVRAARAAIELRHLKEVFTHLPNPVLAVDEYQELLLANRPARELLGIAAEPAEKQALASLVQCEKLVELLSAAAQHQAGGNRAGEVELPDREGRTRVYRVSAARVAQSQPNQQEQCCGGTVAMFEDISEQKNAQKRNAEFVSAVSHEMKAPLAGIKAYVELLADGDAEDEATREEFLSVINGQAERLQRLIDNLLNLARIEAGVVKVSKQHQSLNALLEEALHVVQPAAEAKQIQLYGELSPMYLGVYADRDMLLQAAINLLSNAVKYTHPQGKIALRSRIDGDQLRFEVNDTGVGLSAEDCTRVFEKFYRVSKDKNMATGTGLGLPLAKHIVEDVHGGRLTLESTLGVGSTFIVTLPAAAQSRSS